MERLSKLGQRVASKIRRTLAARRGSAAYWSTYTVAEREFTSKDQSKRHYEWRSSQYVDYLALMPVHTVSDKVVLDYGCGPGNDIIGILEKSRPSRLIGADVSEKALEKAKARASLHGHEVELFKISERETQLPLPDKSVDYIHSSGVLHHVSNLETTLAELHRVLKDDGEMRVMVYNQNSIWFHLNTAYLERRKLPNFGAEITNEEIFKRTTDGKECPISRAYVPNHFVDLVC